VTGFKGWHVLGASFVTAMLLAGATFYSFQHFVTPIETEFNLTRQQTNYGMILFLLSAAVWAAIVGQFLERLKPRPLALFGLTAFSLGFIAISKMQDPKMMLWVIGGPIGLGFTACGPFMANALTTNWFYKMRGRALGIAAVATSAGGFVVQPIFSYLIATHGWRDALFYVALVVAAISFVLIGKYFINKPEDIGQFPDGANAPAPQSTTAANPSKILRNRDFWVIAIACGLLLACDQALLISLKPFGEDLGFSNAQATLIPTMVAGSAILGKIGIGWMVERFDKRYIFALVCASNIAFLLTAILADGFMAIAMISSVAGIAIGGIYPVWTSITADTFGREYFAPAIGLMNLITVLLAVVAMGFIGSSHDTHGNYYTAFKVLIPVAILAAIVMMFVRVKGKDHG